MGLRGQDQRADSPGADDLVGTRNGHAFFPEPDFLQPEAALARTLRGAVKEFAEEAGLTPAIAQRVVCDPKHDRFFRGQSQGPSVSHQRR